MGHRFSKASPTIVTTNCAHSISDNVGCGNHGTYSDIYGVRAEVHEPASRQQEEALTGQSLRVSIPGPTINLHISESPTRETLLLSQSSNSSLSSVHTDTSSSTCPRQIIIKIQLAKMENGNSCARQQTPHDRHHSALDEASDANSNQILNVVPLNRNLAHDAEADTRTAGSSGAKNNCSRLEALQLSVDEGHRVHTMAAESAEYCDEVLVTDECSTPGEKPTLCSNERNGNGCKVSGCPRRAKTKTLLSSSVGATASTSKRRICRDAFRRILDPSSVKLGKNKERKEYIQQHSSSSAVPKSCGIAPTSMAPLQQQLNNNNRTWSSTNSTSGNSIAAESPAAATANQLSIWAPAGSGGDVIIPFVVVQCPHSSLVTVGSFDDSNGSGLRLMTTDIVRSEFEASALLHAATTAAVVGANGSASSRNVAPRSLNTLARPGTATPNAPIVHSQVDFVHCLVPDLERITNSSFYWGKMDRYEAERLLDSKPEGTFLLRDSAQEEFLFSVTFRKYGRSLHARIEQSGHKFSFDCHDPCVFTASTVTGLLEHYKDPACVMFFEPMLTIPLQRKTTFSLQQLCRANIVSHTTYDGITDLELPVRLKSYLREYHYKQKLRVKPFDEPFYTCT